MKKHHFLFLIILYIFHNRADAAIHSNKVVVIGGGAGGSVAALELSKYFEEVVIIEKNTIMGRTSGLNPGRNAHGFHYTDYSTCKEMLIGALCFEDYFPSHRRNAQSGWYLVVKQSQVSPAKYLNVCEFIKETYKDIRNQYQTDFGSPENFYKVLPKSRYEQFVDSDKVALAIETHEFNIDVDKLAETIRNRLASKENIIVKNFCEVFDARKTEDQYLISYKDKNKIIHEEKYDIVVNATWEHRQYIDSLVGVLPAREHTNRLKALALVSLPEELIEAPSMMFVRGPFGMFSNKGNGQGFLTYAPVTNLKKNHSISFPKSWEEEITYKGELTEEMRDLGEKIIKGVSQFIPAMKKAQLIEIRKGIVQAPGDGDIYDKNSAIHKRDQSGVECLSKGWYSFDTGKLILAPIHAKNLIKMMSLSE